MSTWWINKCYMSFGELYRHRLLHGLKVCGPTIPGSISENGSGSCTARSCPDFQIGDSGILGLKSMVMDPYCDLQIQEVVSHKGELLLYTIPHGKASGMNDVGM